MIIVIGDLSAEVFRQTLSGTWVWMKAFGA